jgi:hypothetical protein
VDIYRRALTLVRHSVAAFLGLMNRDFGSSFNSDTTGPGAIALFRDKICEMGDGESMESKGELW